MLYIHFRFSILQLHKIKIEEKKDIYILLNIL